MEINQGVWEFLLRAKSYKFSEWVWDWECIPLCEFKKQNYNSSIKKKIKAM